MEPSFDRAAIAAAKNPGGHRNRDERKPGGCFRLTVNRFMISNFDSARRDFGLALGALIPGGQPSREFSRAGERKVDWQIHLGRHAIKFLKG